MISYLSRPQLPTTVPARQEVQPAAGTGSHGALPAAASDTRLRFPQPRLSPTRYGTSLL